jgi:hypothetical protein
VIKQLTATGHASSLYHLAPSDSAERRAALNYVTARIITVAFNDQKVATVTTVDSIAGVYVEPRPDSTQRRTVAPAKPDVPSIVPLPTPLKPPPSPPSKPPANRPVVQAPTPPTEGRP